MRQYNKILGKKDISKLRKELEELLDEALFRC